MTFVHESVEFGDLLEIVSRESGLGVALVEKDYWVTHSLWALHRQGFDIWFKGGTSLSKGFGIIERFSEDLDLKIEPGRVADIPKVTNWKSEGKKATSLRRDFFDALLGRIHVPGASAEKDPTLEDRSHRSAGIRIFYPGHHLEALSSVFRPFVLLEIGSARVTPCVERDMTSFVHRYLEQSRNLQDFEDNRPKSVRCVHPLVTLLEKLDALQRRVSRPDVEPATFIRHFEDAARIIQVSDDLPDLHGYEGIKDLAGEMLGEKQIAALPSSANPAFNFSQRPELESAWQAITPTYWGARVALGECCERIRTFLDTRGFPE